VTPEPAFWLEEPSHLLEACSTTVTALVVLHELLDFQRHTYIDGAFRKLPVTRIVLLQQRLQAHIEMLFSLTDTSFSVASVNTLQIQEELTHALELCKYIRQELADLPAEGSG
jgi:hypothetical protein